MINDSVHPAGEAMPAIYQHNDRKLVNARELHQYLEIQSKFADWIQNRIEKYGFVADEDYTTFSKSLEKGRPTIEYGLTIEMAKELAMVENNEKGRIARRYFIECERKLKEARPALPDVVAMAQLILEQYGKNEELTRHVDRQSAEIKRLAPRAAFAEQVVASPDLMTFGQAAKVLEAAMGRNNLFKWMRQQGYLFGKNEPKQEYIDRGYFVLKEVWIQHNSGKKLHCTPYFTQKGLAWTFKKLKEAGKLRAEHADLGGVGS